MSRSHHLVDADLLPMLHLQRSRRMSLEALPGYRLETKATACQLMNEFDGIETTELEVNHNPGVRMLTYRPLGIDQRIPAILHMHGGGFVLGCPEMVAASDAHLARSVGVTVFSVAYRLAPEAPYPAALDDCFDALTHLVRHADQLRIDPKRIAVLGESAGGGLAAALTLLARDRGGPAIDFQMLIFPMLDDRVGTLAEAHPYAGEFLWTPESNQFGWNAIKGPLSGSEEIPYYLAPARAPDLAGLPPTFIDVGALDLFVEEDLEYARRLIRGGVPTELHVYPGAFHGFHLAQNARVSKRASKIRLAAWRRWIDGASSTE